jgi:hypothetical protein
MSFKTKCCSDDFCQIIRYNFYRGKKGATSGIKNAKSKKSPNRRKFAQSGHPGAEELARTFGSVSAMPE